MAQPSPARQKDPIRYTHLHALSTSLDSIDTATSAFQHLLSRRIHASRSNLISQIPHFWPLVLEQAPAELDSCIQPSDSALFASSLTSLSVERFEIRANDPAIADVMAELVRAGSGGDVSAAVEQAMKGPLGEPRSVAVTFTFAPNEHFTDTTLTKKFFHRHARSGWAGLVSEPVRIHWKEGKDLTDGLTDLACELFEAQARTAGEGDVEKTPEYARLLQKVEKSTEGSLSFFAWFGFRGPWVGEAEDREVRERIARGEEVGAKAGDGKEGAEGDDEGEEDVDPFPLPVTEIFPEGEDVAACLAENIYPNALQYFEAAQMDDDEEGNGWEDEDEGSFDEEELEKELGGPVDEGASNLEDIRNLSKKGGGAGPPSKKRKT